jgi:hypothetical protein
MKWKTKEEEYTAPHTRDGITEMITRTRQVRVPVLPRDWDTVATRAAVLLVMSLTLVSIAWSTWSIGSLLNGGIGFGAAGVFDLSWAVCLILEWKSRFEAEKRAFPQRLGWWLLIGTMGAIFWHGMNMGSVGMAVTGAAVSAFAKVLWLGVMKHINKELSPDDAQWVAQQISAANAKMAVASARRAAARSEHRAAAELLAMEAEAREFGGQLPDVSGAFAPAGSADATSAVPQGAAAGVADAPERPALPAQAVTVTPEHLAAALALLQGVTGSVAPAAPAAGADAGQAVADADVIDADDVEEESDPLEPPTLASLSKADAIRIATRRRPDASAAEIAALLGGYDVKVSADYVRQVQSRDAAANTSSDDDADVTEAESTTGAVVPLRKV